MTPERPLFFPPFRFDPVKPCLLRGEELIPLRKKNLAVLRYLVEHSRVVAKKELLGDIWHDTYVSAGVPVVCIRELRRASRVRRDLTRIVSKRFVRTSAGSKAGAAASANRGARRNSIWWAGG